MATQAPTTQVVQSSSHALERLQRPLPDVLRRPLVRHFEEWGNAAEVGGRDLALALVKVLQADCPSGALDAFAHGFNAEYLRQIRETTVAAPGCAKSFAPNAGFSQLVQGSR